MGKKHRRQNKNRNLVNAIDSIVMMDRLFHGVQSSEQDAKELIIALERKGYRIIKVYDKTRK